MYIITSKTRRAGHSPNGKRVAIENPHLQETRITDERHVDAKANSYARSGWSAPRETIADTRRGR